MKLVSFFSFSLFAVIIGGVRSLLIDILTDTWEKGKGGKKLNCMASSLTFAGAFNPSTQSLCRLSPDVGRVGVSLLHKPTPFIAALLY